jgi:hypothetical protein
VRKVGSTAPTRPPTGPGRAARHNPPMPATPELDAAERAALAAELRQVIATARFLLSPRIQKLRAILATGGPCAATATLPSAEALTLSG